MIIIFVLQFIIVIITIIIIYFRIKNYIKRIVLNLNKDIEKIKDENNNIKKDLSFKDKIINKILEL